MPVMLFGAFALFILLGLPIAIAIGLSSIGGMFFFTDIPLELGAQRMLSGLRSFPLLAIPMFVLAGSIMNAGGITTRLINFAYALIGPMKGGLSAVTIVTHMIFGGISGSAVADAGSVGKIMIPQMVKRGYPRGYAASVNSIASTIALVIPPSITMIIYGVTANVSIGDLFFHGLYIGIGFAIIYITTGYIIARVKNLPSEQRVEWAQVRKAFFAGIWSLFLPIIVLGGIRLGVFTATEGGAVAVTVAVILGGLVYRELTWDKIKKVMTESAILVSTIMFIIAMAQIYSWALVTAGIPQQLSDLVLSITDNMFVILLFINILLLLIGAVMEGNAAIIVFTPILLPMVTAVGVDPVHFGLIVVINLAIGLVTPPVGICLLLSTQIAGIRLEQAFKDLIPWFLTALGLLLIVTYIPLFIGFY